MDVLWQTSPWWWIALAILLAAIELLTISTVLIWSACAAVLTAFALWAFPELGLAAQIALFATASILLLIVGRWAMERFAPDPARTDNPKLNRRAEQLTGRTAEVVAFSFHEGQVTIDGVPWPARLDGTERTPAPGDRMEVIATDGIVVWVRPLGMRRGDPGDPRS